MTLLYYHPSFLDHETGQHPECAQRLSQVIGHLEENQLVEGWQRPEWSPATDAHILIVDWDVHHGNGTQAIFYDDPRVSFFSAHRWPFYPGTGDVDETGTGDGLGTTRNLPVKFGTSREEYQSRFVSQLEDFASRCKPQLVMISAGFDGHRQDPVGSLGLEVEDYLWQTHAILQIAESYAEGRVVSALEGGYNRPILAECVAAHLGALRPQ